MLHVSGIQHGNFIPLSNIKGSANDKLTQLHCIRDRRLLEPLDSPSHKPSCSFATQLFPPECIFCNKLEVKASGSTEQCINFDVLKDKKGMLKEPIWERNGAKWGTCRSLPCTLRCRHP
ncbi:hypothetical protein E2C01_085960 [Portunus trituberculatus]|uniref:Uncharacterized protein n=1 Tax=Portunus trituberculatus TaxID=210409 RepID=A0A5B7J902_PORTR|nr:hypothetical protein [Portunus trituberculatus]